MADRMAARIEIGGDVPEQLVDELVSLIVDSGAGFEWGERTDEEETRAAIEAAVAGSEPLALTDDEATWGRFEPLEDWLIEQRIPWRRHSSAKYEYDAEIVWFLPGMEEPETVAANEDANVLVPLDDLRGLLERCSGAAVETALRDIVAANTPPDLPPLRIVPSFDG
jgi:hypothetical protein